MEKQYKILVLVVPAYGHFNPMVSFINELAKTKNLKVFFPGNEVDRKIIEAARAEFVSIPIEIFGADVNLNELRNNFPFEKMMRRSMDVTTEVLPKLAELVAREQIDLVIYDFASSYGKWLKEHLENLQRKRQFTGKIPKFVMFSPSILCAKGIYPNKAEPPFFPKPRLSFMFFFKLITVMLRYAFFCWKHGFKLENPYNVLFYREELNLVSVIPEFQPRSHLFDKVNVFVGSCASEELRGSKELVEPLKSFLAPFEPSNPVPLINMRVDEDFIAKRKTKLIYVAFGTLFNQDIRPYLNVIDAFNSLEQSETGQLKLLISTGDKTFAKFQEMIKKGEYKNQDNILLMNKVPQLDVLQRASVFITHSGQGSSSEAMHYGVPMICIPVFGDQPPVAYRAADELGLGIRLDYDKLSANIVKEALLKILNDRSYLERVSLYAQLSRKHNGPQTATKLVIQYLQKTK